MIWSCRKAPCVSYRRWAGWAGLPLQGTVLAGRSRSLGSWLQPRVTLSLCLLTDAHWWHLDTLPGLSNQAQHQWPAC